MAFVEVIAFCAEMEAEPFTAERSRLASRCLRLNALRRAVSMRLQTTSPLCPGCETPLDNHGTCWECEELAREQAEALASDVCPCGEAKVPGQQECFRCVRAMEQDWARDLEEEERHKRLLKCLPNGDYTASEMAEYLS